MAYPGIPFERYEMSKSFTFMAYIGMLATPEHSHDHVPLSSRFRVISDCDTSDPGGCKEPAILHSPDAQCRAAEANCLRATRPLAKSHVGQSAAECLESMIASDGGDGDLATQSILNRERARSRGVSRSALSAS